MTLKIFCLLVAVETALLVIDLIQRKPKKENAARPAAKNTYFLDMGSLWVMREVSVQSRFNSL